MKTFKEMLDTAADRRKLNQTILDTPGLKDKYFALIKIENSIYKAVNTLALAGDLKNCDAFTDDEKCEVQDALAMDSCEAVNNKVVEHLVNMACIPLQYEAYKILCKSEGSE